MRGTVPSSNLEEMNYEREVGGRERGMSLWDTSGIVSKIWQMILFLPSLLSPTSAEISSLL